MIQNASKTVLTQQQPHLVKGRDNTRRQLCVRLLIHFPRSISLKICRILLYLGEICHGFLSPDGWGIFGPHNDPKWQSPIQGDKACYSRVLEKFIEKFLTILI